MGPAPIKKMMDNVENTRTFKDRWAALDVDGSGTLEIHELLPVVQEMCEGNDIDTDDMNGASMDTETLTAFAKMFDENGDGVINKQEFADFIRFCLAMSFAEELRKAEEEVEAIEAASQDPTKKGQSSDGTESISKAKKKASIIDISEEDMQVMQMSAADETRIAKIQAAYRGKKDRKLAAKKKEEKELQEWTDGIGEEADQMASKLQAMHKKKLATAKKRASKAEDDEMSQQLATLKKSKTTRDETKMQKRKSEVNQEGASDTLFAALADEELAGNELEGNFDISMLSEEHQALLQVSANATESSEQVMRKKKAEQARQREQEAKQAYERRQEELKQWALSFGVEGDDAARKIQKVWRGGAASLLKLKAEQQVQVETYTSSKKKGKKKDALSKELAELGINDDKELKEMTKSASVKAGAKKQAKAKAGKLKADFQEAKTEPPSRSPRPGAAPPRSPRPPAKEDEEKVDPKDFEGPEMEAAATKLQSMQRGKKARAKTQALKGQK